jgi:hypothetical protein
LVCVMFARASDTSGKSGAAVGCGLIAFMFGLAGAGCFLIALIRFVKWVWGS